MGLKRHSRSSLVQVTVRRRTTVSVGVDKCQTSITDNARPASVVTVVPWIKTRLGDKSLAVAGFETWRRIRCVWWNGRLHVLQASVEEMFI